MKPKYSFLIMKKSIWECKEMKRKCYCFLKIFFIYYTKCIHIQNYLGYLLSIVEYLFFESIPFPLLPQHFEMHANINFYKRCTASAHKRNILKVMVYVCVQSEHIRKWTKYICANMRRHILFLYKRRGGHAIYAYMNHHNFATNAAPIYAISSCLK